MNPLLTELDDDQGKLLGLIYDQFEQHARWPIWQFLDLKLKTHGAASRALEDLPRVSGLARIDYGLVRWETSGGLPPNPDTQVAVTVAGLHRIAPDSPLLKHWVNLLRYVITRQRGLEPSPTEVVTCEVEDYELRDVLSPGGPVSGLRLTQLRMLIEQEPFFWRSCISQPLGDDSPWSIMVPATILRYESVHSIGDYIERLSELVAPEPPPPELAPSGLTVSQAVSFLDAVWDSRLRRRLFRDLDASSIERLAWPVTNAAEFDSWVSALADVLSRIEVPPDSSVQRKNRRSITALADYLRLRLTESSAIRVDEAVDFLERIVDVRTGAQHSDARGKAREGLRGRRPTVPSRKLATDLVDAEGTDHPRPRRHPRGGFGWPPGELNLERAPIGVTWSFGSTGPICAGCWANAGSPASPARRVGSPTGARS